MSTGLTTFSSARISRSSGQTSPYLHPKRVAGCVYFHRNRPLLCRRMGVGRAQSARSRGRHTIRVSRRPRWFYRRSMTETQRQSVPRVDSGELDTSLAFLRFARECVIKKLDGLDEEQARRVLVPSGTSLLGLVRHLCDGERYWFGYHLTGLGSEPDWDRGMTAEPGQRIVDVVEQYRAAIADSDAAISRLGDPAALAVMPVDGQPKTLRWTIAHMTSETARHAGHADILREQIDGATGR